MTDPDGRQLSQLVRRQAEAFKTACRELNEETASRAPEGRWSPKQIISHLCGPEGIGYLPMLQAILAQDTPRFDFEGENPFFTEKRARMSLAELLAEFETEYGRMADLVAGLSPDQLNRRAHIPLFKETPLTEYPTLAGLVAGLVDYHVNFHIDHLGEVRKGLGL